MEKSREKIKRERNRRILIHEGKAIVQIQFLFVIKKKINQLINSKNRKLENKKREKVFCAFLYVFFLLLLLFLLFCEFVWVWFRVIAKSSSRYKHSNLNR